MFLSILALAFQAAAAQPAPAVAPSTVPAKPKMICEYEEEIGSRLKGKRICRTADEWAKMRQDSRMSLEIKQQQMITPSQ